MKKRTKRLFGITAIAVGAVSAAGVVLLRMTKFRPGSGGRRDGKSEDVWARPGMSVTFRAELMPGRDPSERVFRVKELLPSGRVLLHDFAGEHNEKEFEHIK